MYIGIDLGGTKIEVICLNESGDELYRHRIPTPHSHYSQTLSAVKQLVEQAESVLMQSGSVGVGIPGSICSKKNRVKNANSTWLNGRPFKADLEAALSRPILVENDANCFVISEAMDGAAENKHSVFGAILGTGCGGGIVVGGKLVEGVNGLSGEWGHNPLPFPTFCSDHSSSYDQHVAFFDCDDKVKRSSIYERKKTIEYVVEKIEDAEYPGPSCFCGKRGCLETWISGTGLSRDYRRTTGDDLRAEDIVALAQVGKAAALNCLDRYYERLAKSFAQMINIIDPDIIVCGGGMSNVAYLYEEIPKRWDKYIFSNESTTGLVQAQHGDSSGVRGAALLWKK